MNGSSVIRVDSGWSVNSIIQREVVGLADNKENGILNGIEVATSPGGQKIAIPIKRVCRIGSFLDGGRKLENVDKTVYAETYLAEDADAIFDSCMRNKVQDVSLPYTERSYHYGPISDVNSRNMKVVIPEDLSDSMSNNGVDVQIMDEELTEVHSVDADNEQVDLSKAIDNHRHEIEGIVRQMGIYKVRILSKYPDWSDLPDDVFLQRCAKSGDPRCVDYLKMEQHRIKHKMFIDTYSSQVISSTVPKLYIPDNIRLDDLRFPAFNCRTQVFDYCHITFDELNRVANRDVESTPVITAADLPEIEINF